MSTNVDIHHLAAAYALDALDPHERAAFEAHYPSCDVCRRDVIEFRTTLAAVGEASASAPPADMKARVMGQIATTRQLPPHVPPTVVDLHSRRAGARTIVLSAAAALVLLVAGTGFVLGRSGRTTDAFAAELAQVLQRPDARMVDLPSKSAAAVGEVRLVWSPSAHEVAVIGDGLQPAGSGKAYELWLIDPSGSAPMNLLDPAGDGSVRRVIPMSASPTQWGVTIEPRAGSPVATGPILFLGAA